MGFRGLHARGLLAVQKRSGVLRTLSIRHRLLALSALGVVLTVVVGLAAVLALWRASDLATQIDRQASVHESTARIRFEAQTLSHCEQNLFVAANSPTRMARIRREIAETDGEMRRTLLELEQGVTNEPDRAAVATLRQELDAYILQLHRISDALDAGALTSDRQQAALTKDAAKHMRALQAAGDQLLGQAREQQRAGGVELSELSDRLGALLAVATGLLALMALGVGLSVNRSVSRPLVKTLNVLEGIARGELNQQLELGQTDELGRIATSLNTAIQRMRNDREQIERLATTDALTGLTNRRAFSDTLTVEVARARRYGFKMSLLLFDIDHFKKVNDQHGHGVGDIVLSRVGKLVLSQIRTSDIAARWGGEEFVIALPHVGLDGAAVVAARIRIACQDMEITTEKGKLVPTTVSIGVAELGPGDTLESLAERADHAMYAAKRQGRNRVLINDGALVSMPPQASRQPASKGV